MHVSFSSPSSAIIKPVHTFVPFRPSHIHSHFHPQLLLGQRNVLHSVQTCPFFLSCYFVSILSSCFPFFKPHGLKHTILNKSFIMPSQFSDVIGFFSILLRHQKSSMMLWIVRSKKLKQNYRCLQHPPCCFCLTCVNGMIMWRWRGTKLSFFFFKG